MRVMLIHSRDRIMDLEAETGYAHCFGPFDSFDEAVAWSEKGEEDTCYKLILEIVGPGAYDMALAEAEEARLRNLPPEEHDHRTRLD